MPGLDDKHGESAQSAGKPTTDLPTLFADYVERLTAGEKLDRAALLKEHPDAGSELLKYLEDFVELGGDGDAPLALRSLGDYELLRRVGRGGMGVVYEAWEKSMDRRVALKVLPAAVAADPKTFMRFCREARRYSSTSCGNSN